MTQKEFEDRTGKKVSPDDFEIVNRIYMTAGEMDKDRFCKNWDDSFLGNPIIAELTKGAERWINASLSTQEILNKRNDELATAKREIAGLQYQVKSRDEKIDQLTKAIEATVEIINLACFESLKKKYEDIFGKGETMRMRHEHGWDLSKEDVEWLLSVADDDDYED